MEMRKFVEMKRRKMNESELKMNQTLCAPVAEAVILLLRISFCFAKDLDATWQFISSVTASRLYPQVNGYVLLALAAVPCILP
jgi:hypothetical protein